jgi:hypothetical protein
MRASRLEEVFEECLSAYVEGRRSIAESLSLYPGLAARLEPLLRTAAQVADNFQRQSPPAPVQERGREHFLAAARTRRRARALTDGIGARRWGLSWRLPQWSALGGAAMAALTVVVVTAAVLTNGSSGGDGDPSVFNDPATTAARQAVTTLTNLNTKAKDLASRAQPLDSETIKQMTEATQQIVNDPTLTPEDRSDAEKALKDSYLIVTTVASPDPATSDPIRGLLDATQDAANRLNIPIPTFVAPTPTPAPTAPPSATPAATSEPTPEPTAEPTPAPTTEPARPTPTPEVPTPVPSDDIRQPQIGN